MSAYPPTMTNTMLATLCQQERATFYRNHNIDSPACLELFRRAFAADQEAWEKVITGFTPQVARWVKSWEKLLTLVEPADLIQDAFLNFQRYAPKRPQLLTGSSLGPVIEYLRLCTKSAALQLQRKYKGLTSLVDLEDQAEMVAPVDHIEQTMLRSALAPFIERWVETPDEQLIFTLYFEYNYKPQEIFAGHKQRFQNYNEVAKILQRLLRRIRKDADEVESVLYKESGPRQKSIDPAFLTFSVVDNQRAAGNKAEDINVDRPEQADAPQLTPCPYDEVILIEYLLGRADPILIGIIERSTVCRQAAAEIQKSIGPLLTHLYRYQCPDPLTLLEYQERLLPGIEQLIIHRHVEECPHCQRELQLSTMLDHAARPFEEAVTPVGKVRRVVEAIFQSPLTAPQPVRGELGSYRTAQVVIRLNVRQNAGRARTWVLRGQIRNAAGNLIAESVEQILLQRLDDEQATELATTIAPEENSFVYKELLAGNYRLHVITADEEITIRNITVGTDE